MSSNLSWRRRESKASIKLPTCGLVWTSPSCDCREFVKFGSHLRFRIAMKKSINYAISWLRARVNWMVITLPHLYSRGKIASITNGWMKKGLHQVCGRRESLSGVGRSTVLRWTPVNLSHTEHEIASVVTKYKKLFKSETNRSPAGLSSTSWKKSWSKYYSKEVLTALKELHPRIPATVPVLQQVDVPSPRRLIEDYVKVSDMRISGGTVLDAIL